MYNGIESIAHDFPDWLTILTSQVAGFCGVTTPDAVNINLYSNGSQGVGWHSDDEQIFGNAGDNVTIISLSLGATRTFEVKRKGTDDVLACFLKAGDVLIMSGQFQRFYVHRIPKEWCSEPRINLTWRFIKKHNDDCTL